jgi:tripartite-type tricarboxylate transporter receptor subunit TctC
MRLLNVARTWIAMVGLTAGLTAGVAAQAQAPAFPSKPLTLTVAWPAGGASDFIARVLAKEMSASLGQNIIINNVPGASGSLGTSKAMNAPADGYTLMLSSPIELILSPLIFASATYKPEDARAIMIVGRSNLMLVARKDLPASNPAELIALMKANGGRPLTYCTPGIGSLYHLVGEHLNAAVGVKSLHVPYTGFPQCLNDLAGGTIDFAFLPVAAPFTGFVDNASIKAMAVLGSEPSHRFPGLPLASATRGLEDFSFSIWAGLHVHAKVSDAVAEVLNRHANAVLANPEVRKVIEQSGAVVSPPQTLQQAQAEYLDEIQRYTGIAKAVGLQKQ